MNAPSPECPRCRVRMEPGFVAGPTQGGMARFQWIEGPPDKAWWGGFKTKGRRRHDVMAHRCDRCGYLIWFAPASPDGKP